MALRDQPYLPLYVNDFVSDEKLRNCSAESTGVYIRLMCFMHRQPEYGKILLRQNERQSDRQVHNFAVVLAKQMPYGIDVIERSLEELLTYEIVYIEGDELCQKRMVKDGIISEIRSKSGKKGAESANSRFKGNDDFAEAKHTANHSAKPSANSDIDNDIENEIEINKKGRNNFDFTNVFSGDLKDAFDDWLAYKRERHQAYRERGLKILVSQVKKYADQFGAAETADAIRNSIANNYQGIVFDRIGKNAGTEDKRRRAKAPEEYRGKDFFSDGGL